MYSATLVFSPESETIAKAIEAALLPEAGRELPKAESRVLRAGADVTVAIDAEDASSLRAAVNSYVRWAKTAEDAARVALGSKN